MSLKLALEARKQIGLAKYGSRNPGFLLGTALITPLESKDIDIQILRLKYIKQLRRSPETKKMFADYLLVNTVVVKKFKTKPTSTMTATGRFSRGIAYPDGLCYFPKNQKDTEKTPMRNTLRAALLAGGISCTILITSPAQALESQPAKNSAPVKQRETWQDPVTGMKFVKIEGGCFQMGQNPTEQRYLKRDSANENFEKYFADELPQHKVCVEEFWMGSHEVTQGEWQKVMEFNPAVFQDGENYPVEMVSWDDAQNFLTKFNLLNNTSQFRLPSEAEWEYAARAGTTSIYNTGDAIKSTEANFNGTFPFGLNLRDEYRKSTMPVGSFPANAFGLYDMHGNVWEWCNDWYNPDYYKQEIIQNPPGPEASQMKVLRGGSWFRYSAHIRSATRYKNKQSGQYADTGFRVVKSTLRLNSDSGKPLLFDKDF